MGQDPLMNGVRAQRAPGYGNLYTHMRGRASRSRRGGTTVVVTVRSHNKAIASLTFCWFAQAAPLQCPGYYAGVLYSLRAACREPFFA
jgi:hypothetical protein